MKLQSDKADSYVFTQIDKDPARYSLRCVVQDIPTRLAIQ